MSSPRVQESVEVESTEVREKRKEMERTRALVLLNQHVHLGQRIRTEEQVRRACNVILAQSGFSDVKPKAASVGRSVRIRSGISDDELHRLVWYGMNGYQSRLLGQLSRVANVQQSW